MKTEIVNDRIYPYQRDYIEKFEPPVGGELLVLGITQTAESEYVYQFMYKHPEDKDDSRNIKIGKFEHVRAYVYGSNIKNASAINGRIHSPCIFSEELGSTECDCLQQRQKARQIMMDDDIPGILVIQGGEARGHGLFNKLRIYKEMGLIDPTPGGFGIRTLNTNRKATKTTYEACEALGLTADVRNYRASEAIFQYFNPSLLYLLTDNPTKVASLVQAGLQVIPKIMEIEPPSEVAAEYRRVKLNYFQTKKYFTF